MDVVSIIFASLVLLSALALIAAFLKLVVDSIGGDVRALPGAVKLKKRTKGLAAADALVDEGKLKEAATALHGAFLLDQVEGDEAFLDKVNNHNLSVLARFVNIAEKRETHIANLPLLEELLVSRHELLRGLQDISYHRRKLKEKRREKGQETPQWAEGEFERKQAETLDRLETNRKSIDTQIKDLIKNLSKDQSNARVTYH